MYGAPRKKKERRKGVGVGVGGKETQIRPGKGSLVWGQKAVPLLVPGKARWEARVRPWWEPWWSGSVWKEGGRAHLGREC